MHTTLQEPVCPKLQRIRDVNRDAARLRLNVLPLPAGRFDLQRGDGLREEEGETAEVVVAAGVEVFVAGVFGGCARGRACSGGGSHCYLYDYGRGARRLRGVRGRAR